MKKSITALSAVALLALTACGSGEQKPSTAPTTEPAPTVTETVTATPEPQPTESERATDEWLAEAREDHLNDLVDWIREYREADCMASDAECYDLFAKGVPMMQEYSEWVRNSTDKPDYVSTTYAMDAGHAARRMDAWQYACPDAGDCYDIALDAGSRAFNVITETKDWGE